MLCLAAIVAFATVAIVAGLVWPDWTSQYDYDNLNQPPSGDNWFGTDAFGRSVLRKTLLGAKVSMTVGFMSNIIAIPLGILLGAIAGYYGGIIDDIVVWLFTTLAAVPGLIRIIAVKFAFMGVIWFEGTWLEMNMGGMAGICLALAIMGWIGTCRYVRAEVMKIRELDYVIAARAIGTPSFIILLRHVIPNVIHIGIINFSLGFIAAVKTEVVLSYLGLGVTDMPSWGSMISDAQTDLLVGRWWQLAAATVSMFILVLSLNIFGDRLRDALDPKLRKA